VSIAGFPRRYFAPIHRQPAYAESRDTICLPVTESVAARTLALPFFNRIRDEQIERVCKVLKAALRRESQPLIPADPQNESSEI
jgi:perosamine synthetase